MFMVSVSSIGLAYIFLCLFRICFTLTHNRDDFSFVLFTNRNLSSYDLNIVSEMRRRFNLTFGFSFNEFFVFFFFEIHIFAYEG